MTQHSLLPAIIAVALAVLTAGQTSAAEIDAGEKPLSVGITGSAPPDARKNPTSILASARIQRLILEISRTPKTRSEIEAVISGETFTVDDMVNVGLLRNEDGRYHIEFNLLHVADQERILEVSERMGRELAAAFLVRRSEFELLAKSHVQPHVGKADLLFITLGCFSLDWDGLDLTEQHGYRAGAQRTIDGHSFTPWAKERGMALSLKELYWGSHSSSGSVIFTTFGDHDALPRFGLPDIIWNSGASFDGYGDLLPGRRAAALLIVAYMKDALDDAGRVMLALGEEERSLEALAYETGIESHKLEQILALLQEADYITRDGNAYAGRVIVLTKDDEPMVRAMLAAGREIMIAWHEANYDKIRGALSDLTPLRNGVPFERVYTEVWHFVFGIANRELVKAGLFADPYAAGRRHKGFVPFVRTSDLPVSAP